jgi:Rad52/22 family double-strand break repair protein
VLHYLEGWHVVAEANRIFGFDGWNRETVNSNCVYTKQIGQRYCAAYVTRVRIVVRAGEDRIIREGCGAGESNASSPGQAHEFAAKAAETDATKRALSTFGNAFGLSLYGGSPDTRTRDGRRVKRDQQVGNLSIENSGEPRNAADAATIPTVIAQSSDDQLGTGLTVPMEQSASDEETEPRAGFPAWPEIDPLEEAAARAQEHRSPIDKSVLSLSEPRRRRDQLHLSYVASKPCAICGRTRAHAHHLKFMQPTALGKKVSDEFTVPLCSVHHRELHQSGAEQDWWQKRGIDPEKMAQELWRASHPELKKKTASL